MAEPSFISVSTNTSFVDNFRLNASYGCIFGRMDESLDEIDSQSHHYEKNVHLFDVHGGHFTIIRTYQCTGMFCFLPEYSGNDFN